MLEYYCLNFNQGQTKQGNFTLNHNHTLIPLTQYRQYPHGRRRFVKHSLSLDHHLTSISKLASQSRTVHCLVHPMETLKCLKFPPLNLLIFKYGNRGGGVQYVHKVVIWSPFGVILRHKASGGKWTFHHFVTRLHTKPWIVAEGQGHFIKHL